MRLMQAVLRISIPVGPLNNRSPMKRAICTAMVLVGILAAAGGYKLYRGMRVSSAQPCFGKLMNIAAAKDQWATDTGATSGSPVAVETIVAYLRSMPTCPVAGAPYIVGRVGEEPRCTTHRTVSHFKPDHY